MEPKLFKTLQTSVVGLYVFIALHAGLVLAEPALDALPEFKNIPDPTVANTVVDGNVLNININQDRAILDFNSHDIGANATVNYNGNTNFHVLGNIHDQSASQIFGTLNSDVNLTLINKYGFIFGPDSVVNASSLTASALNSAFPFDINDTTRDNEADFTTFAADQFDQPVEVYTGTIDIQEGAQITATDGGNLFFLAPQSVKNNGRLVAQDGQVILAAGSKVYLAQPDSASNLSNILVEVEITNDHVNSINTSNDDETDDFENLLVGHVENAVGEIFADRGIITLLGASVHNNGTLSANTSVKQGGKIRLLAGSNLEDSIGSEDLSEVASVLDNDNIGIITLGENSNIRALPDVNDNATAVEADIQPQSEIEFLGKKVTFGTGSNTVANSGLVNVYNVESRNSSQDFTTLFSSDENKYADFQVVIENGATIDVSGLNTSTSVAKNFVEADLLSNELADSTLAKNNEALRDVLREGPVIIDARNVVTVDGEEFEGTALGDVSGFIDLIEYNVAERSVFGGEINIESQNSVDIQNNAKLDVSGGSIEYTADKIITSKLIEQGTNRIVDIGEASADVNYSSVLDMDTIIGRRIVNSTPEVAGYVEGKSAGTLSINAEQIVSPLTPSNIVGETLIGEFQLQPGLELANSNRPSLSQFSPQGATLILGNSGIASNNFRALPSRLQTVVLDKSFQSSVEEIAQVSTDLFSLTRRGGNQYINFTQLDVTTSDSISLQSNLNVAGEADIDLTSQVINVLANINSASGSVNLQAMESRDGIATQDPSIFISSNSQINLSGSNVNRNFDQTSVAFIKGGDFEIGYLGNSEGALTIQEGALIDVSGGVEFERNLTGLQNVKLGNGGSIDIDVSQLGLQLDDEVSIENALSTFKGYGVNVNNHVSSGATFKFQTDDYICISNATCNFDSIVSNIDLIENFSSEFFTLNGFNDFDLNSELGELKIDAAITLKPQVKQISTNGAGFTTTITQVPELFSQPASLKLSSVREFTFTDSSSIDATVNADIQFNGDNKMYIGGAINAKSGNVEFILNGAESNPDDGGDFDNSLALWFGNTANIDVSSTVITQQINGFNFGQVYESGSINSDSQRGYIVIEESARLLADGIEATIDQENIFGAIVSRNIATSGGTLQFNAGERIFLSSLANNLSVRAPNAQVAGGEIIFSLDPLQRGGLSRSDGPASISGNDYPLRHARFVLSSQSYNPFDGINLQYGDAIETVAGQNGDIEVGVIQGSNEIAETFISTEILNLSGADSLSLKTVDVFLDQSNTTQQARYKYRQGQIFFDDGLDLNIDGVLTLNASEFLMVDEQVTRAQIDAFAVRLGSSNTANDRIIPGYNDEFLSTDSIDRLTLRSPSVTDDQSLSINANIIDVFGDSFINDIKSVTLNSQSDIRLIGLPQENALSTGQSQRTAEDIIGSLQLQDVDLQLIAKQIYPTTLSQFTVNNSGNESSISVSSPTPGSIPLVPYSAYGQLDIITRALTHDSVLRAPEGIVRLLGDNAELSTIDIGSNAVVSVSAADTVIPFGNVLIDEFPIIQFQSAQYKQSGLVDENNLISGSLLYSSENLDLLLEKQLEITADSITLGDGSVLDLSGGGVMLSTQFNRGLLGTKDILRSKVGENTFALAPLSIVDTPVAAIDPSIPAGFDFEYGETVTLYNGIDGLPAGTYVKRPAEYALLPGHILVEQVSGYDGIENTDVLQQLDGSVIVAGIEGFSNGKLSNTSLNAFKLQSRDVINRRANYSVFNFGEVVETHIQPKLDRILRTSFDGGIARINSGSQLQLNGDIIADASLFGQSGALDISSSNIRIVDDTFSADIDGTLVLKESQLNNISIESILLGGTRSVSDSGETTFSINTEFIEFDSGVELDIGELIVVAKGNDTNLATNSVLLNDEVKITAESEAQTSSGVLKMPSDGSVLVVSDLTNWKVELADELQVNTSNNIFIDDNVTLDGHSSVVVGSVNNFEISDTANLSAMDGTVSIVSKEISIIGDNAVIPATGSEITASTISAIDARQLSLLSSTGINLLGQVSVERSNLALQSSYIKAVEGVGSQASASQFNIDNRLEIGGSTSLEDIDVGTGTVLFDVGGEIAFVGDAINFDGFSADESVQFASQLITVKNDSILNLSGGINVTTNQLRFGIGNDLSIFAQSDVTFNSSQQGSSNLNVTEPSLFSEFTINTLGDVNLDTHFVLNSGKFEVNTQGGALTFGSQAQIDLSGQLVGVAEQVIATNGGWLILDAADGDVTFDQPADPNLLTVNLDSNQDADAGLLAIFANDLSLNQAISASSESGNGGAFILHEDEISAQEFTDLNTLLNTQGFTHERLLRSGTGDINLAADEEIISENIRLIADQGGINIAGTLVADSDEGGFVGLYAQQDLTLQESAIISARLLSDDLFSESLIELSSRESIVDLNAGSLINLSRISDDVVSGNGGNLNIIALQNANDVMVEEILSTIEGEEKIFVKAFKQYTSDTINETLINTIKADTDVFGQSVDAIATRLSTLDNAVTVLPRIEITNQNNINIESNWDFREWRYGAQQVAPELVIASANDINIGAENNPVILSDGLDQDLSIINDEFNTSFQLVAGSDLSSADITQTLRTTSTISNLGSIFIAEGSAAIEGGEPVILTAIFGTIDFENSNFYDPNSPLSALEQCEVLAAQVAGSCSGGGEPSPLMQAGIRTGTGDINLYAAGNVEFADEFSGVYTTGRTIGNEGVDFFTLAGIDNLLYGEQGGNISISVGNNLIGATSDSFVNDWIWNTDKASINGVTDGTLGWAANPGLFTGDVATLGGGNITVNVGNNISQLDVSISSIGKQIGAARRTIGDSVVEVVAGGNLDLFAGGDISAPKLYVGKGKATVESRGTIGDQHAGGAIIMLGDAQADVVARNDLNIERVFNPTILLSSQTQLDQIPTDILFNDIGARFFTYTEDTALKVTANTGALTYDPNATFLSQSTGLSEFGAEVSTLPGYVTFTALHNDLNIGGGFDDLIMFPNERGNFDFISGSNVSIGARITQLDFNEQLNPTLNNSINIRRSLDGSIQDESFSVFASINELLSFGIVTDASSSIVRDRYDIRTSNIHKGVGLSGKVDNQNSRILAGNSIVFLDDTNASIVTAEAFDIVAGGDIVTPNILIQNVNDYDVSSINAGGSIFSDFSLTRTGNFVVSDTLSGISIDGPGQLNVLTGNNLDLGSSQGILSRANTFNTSLSTDPAKINILAGFTNFNERVNRFINEYIDLGVQESIYDEYINVFLTNLSQDANQTYGTLITDSSDLSQYQAITQDSLALPFLQLQAEDLQVLDQLAGGTSFDNARLRQIFLNLSETQQFDVVLQAFNNELISGGGAAVLATDIGLGTAGFYAGYQQSFEAISIMFPEHAGALDLLQTQIGSSSGLVGVDTTNPALVGFVTELKTALDKLPNSQQEAVINQIQANIGEGISLTTAINQPLANNGIVNQDGSLIQLSESAANLVNNANNVEGSDIAEFVQTLQIQNDELFAEDVSNVNTPFNLVGGEVGGDINVLVPFGFYNVGGNINPTDLGLNRSTSEQGIISGGGAINMFLGGELFVNLQRVVGIGDEPLNLFSLFDNIDAGSGAKTTIAVSPATYTYNDQGQRIVTFSPSFAGSGIRKLEDADGNLASPGLFTPYGIVDAGDAGIVSDSGISIAALDVQNDTQISQGGESGATSAPVAPTTPTVDAGASNAATNTASNNAVGTEGDQENSTNAFSDDAAAFLNVFVIGIGDGSDTSGEESFDSANAEGEEENDFRQPGCRPNEEGIIPENCVTTL